MDARVLDATRTVLREQGLDGLTLTEVAKRAGVSRPTLYRRFANRDALTLSLLHADLERVWAEVRDAVHPGDDALSFLIDVAAAFFTYYAEDPAVSRVSMQVSIFATGEDAEPFRVQGYAFIAWVADSLRTVQANGGLAEHVDTGVLAQAFFGLYLPVAIAGTTGLTPTVDLQLQMLRAPLEQHLIGLVPG